jgi:DnaJ-class molecular chaperone
MSEYEIKTPHASLQVKCPECDGKGGWFDEFDGSGLYCGQCGGAGYVATDLGREILDLVRRNFRSLVESESNV